jgi:hypothetical protein
LPALVFNPARRSVSAHFKGGDVQPR